MSTIADALVVTRREVRDSLRDWRIVTPILILTLVFPWIMDMSTRAAIDFVEQYSARIIPIHLIPFGTMVVGFFPITFSLIIALETFVGEKERNSLEPLLATPISDAALYLGKLLAAMLPPLIASYLGVGTYLGALYFSIQYVPEGIVLVQLILLTTMEALVMVAGAVVVSSHTTSVRAANLLASFIIVPMAFLLQGESILLFWGQYDALWSIIAALVVADVILIRTGIRTFNREEILAREIDELRLDAIWRVFRQRFTGEGGFSLVRMYREDLPRLLRENRLPIGVTTVVVVGGLAFGWLLARMYPLPSNVVDELHIGPETFQERIATASISLLPGYDTVGIFANNFRSLFGAALLGVFSFGSLPLIFLLVPTVIAGLIAGEAAMVGYEPVLFVAASILPHGIIEVPAAILATAFALRMGASVIAPPAGTTAGQNLLRTLADWVKVFVFVALPLLLLAAWVEANLTLQIVRWLFGR
jgi:uncharacterized membrane protein SpoIIM required for sporulation/ABC-type transport system involved in multi-copper enzyme maturation permease subunit